MVDEPGRKTFKLFHNPAIGIRVYEEQFSGTFAETNSQGLKLKNVCQFYHMFQHLPGLEFYEDSVHTI